MTARDDSSADDPVGVLDRVTLIFETLDEDDDRGMGITELARRSGLPKSTVSRLVGGLVRGNYLERDGATVRLGLRLFELGQLAEKPQRLRRAALPTMSALRGETGGAVELTLRDGGDMVHVAAVRGRFRATRVARIGERSPIDSTAAGSAVRTRSSVSGAGPGIAAVAAPIFSAADGIEGAISVTVCSCDPGPERAAADGPHAASAATQRVDDVDLESAVAAAALVIERRLAAEGS